MSEPSLYDVEPYRTEYRAALAEVKHGQRRFRNAQQALVDAAERYSRAAHGEDPYG